MTATSHTIKVTSEVFNGIQSRQRTRETYSEVIDRLLTAAALLDKAVPVIAAYGDQVRGQAAQVPELVDDHKLIQAAPGGEHG